MDGWIDGWVVGWLVGWRFGGGNALRSIEGKFSSYVR